MQVFVTGGGRRFRGGHVAGASRYAPPRSGKGLVAQPVFKTGEVV